MNINSLRLIRQRVMQLQEAFPHLLPCPDETTAPGDLPPLAKQCEFFLQEIDDAIAAEKKALSIPE